MILRTSRSSAAESSGWRGPHSAWRGRRRKSPRVTKIEFLDRIRRYCQVMIISDTFHEFSEPLVQELGGHSLLAIRLMGVSGL